MKTQIAALFTLTLFAGAALAAPETFDFKDPKGVNNASFHLDAPLESVNGNANGISGTVTFDPANPGATQGKIAVATVSLTGPNSMQNEHMHGPMWLDAAKYPEITFESKEFKNVKTEGNVTTADITGTFTLKGVSKEFTVPIKLTYLKDRLADRLPGKKGDLLVIRASFRINRSDFNIQPGKFEDKVGEDIDLAVNIAGAAPQ